MSVFYCIYKIQNKVYESGPSLFCCFVFWLQMYLYVIILEGYTSIDGQVLFLGNASGAWCGRKTYILWYALCLSYIY